MNEQKKFISPIAIDLGAKNTGVYFAHYPSGISLKDKDIKNFKKSGVVYHLEKDKYTLLMKDRTAKRHQKRGYDRKQMVKRLFKLIWEKHFQLSWNDDVQQTISFLLNRRGFTFLTEEYDKEILSAIPKQVYDQLPAELRSDDSDDIEKNSDGTYNFDSTLTIWSQEKNEKDIKKKYDCIDKKPKEIRSALCVILRLKDLAKYCNQRLEDLKKYCDQNIDEETNNKKTSNNKKKDEQKKLSNVSKWIVDEWDKIGISNLPNADHSCFSKNSFKIIDYIGSLNEDQLKQLCSSIEENLSDQEEKQKELKDSIWEFNPEKFNLEKNENLLKEPINDENKKIIKTHLHHLSYAIYKLHNEIQSGGRYRSKYFEEVKNVLNCTSHRHKYLERFCTNLQSNKFNITSENLSNLIGHLSNLELKPLRKYFNDIKHKNSDQWDEKTLSRIFNRWILKEWRVNFQKDKYKKPEKKGDYGKLKKEWKNSKKSIITFWLKKDPFLTIPPYQDSNNRGLPRCQSLILNPKFLDKKYPQWKEWLSELKELDCVRDYLNDYEMELTNLKNSGAGKSNINKENKQFSYFINQESNKKSRYQKNKDYLDARILQFIFDRVKQTDPLKLNEIYSYTKKLRQASIDNRDTQENTKKLKTNSVDQEDSLQKLKKTIESSELPINLKTNINLNRKDIFSNGNFLHLVCKYYKWRQKARDGRVFIHPKYQYVKDRGYEKTRNFDDTNCLLTYCNRQPRRKSHQILYDVASLLQISHKRFKEIFEIQNGNTNDEKILSWLNQSDFKGLKSCCGKIAKEQKNRRGYLKNEISTIYYTLNKELSLKKFKNSKEEKKEIKGILSNLSDKGNYKIADTQKLYELCEKSKEIYKKIADKIYSEKKVIQLKKDLERNPTKAVYCLAQLNNLVFKDRSGNANTCAVCSIDNAYRMQWDKPKEDGQQDMTAKAQRLPAISTRLIDGAVMRMARVLGKEIAENKWESIKDELIKNSTVHIPIITELNRFEFEPNLDNLKGKKSKNKDDDDKNPILEKEDRIKKSGKGVCPYEGSAIGDEGEIDHIIPQSSQWGTLNDEANLIWSSSEGNKKKGEKIYLLSNLSEKYKKEQFNTIDDKEIEKWIEKEIWDKGNDKFQFGQYTNFINLKSKEQKAFRHALFLESEHSLRKAVIDAIDHRNKNLVNGTQRYFTEVIANNLYKKVLHWNFKNNPIDINNISFDYFGVDSFNNTDGIKDIRENLTKYGKLKNLQKYDKISTESQLPYSHLIDAQIAFCKVANDHQKDGSLKLQIPENVFLFSPTENENNHSQMNSSTIFEKIMIQPKELQTKDVERMLPRPKHINVNHRPLFNQNAVAMNFLKLIEITCNDQKYYLQGFLDLKTLKQYLQSDQWKGKLGIPDKLNNTKSEYGIYARIIQNKKLESIKEIYTYGKDKYQFGYRIQPKTILNKCKLGKNLFTVKIHCINKSKVGKFLINKFNTTIESKDWIEDDVKILHLLQNSCYFTKKEDLHKKDKSGNYTFNKPNEKKFKCAKLVNPQLKYAWEEVEHYLQQSNGDIIKEIKNCPIFKKSSKNNTNDNKSGYSHQYHQKTKKIFSLPLTTQKGFLIKKRSWNQSNVFYCRPASNDFSQTVLQKNQEERLSNVYRKNNIFYHEDNKKKFEQHLQSIEYDLAIDSNKYYDAEIPPEFDTFIDSIQNKRTDSTRPRFIFKFKSSPQMNFKKFIEFILQYPFRALESLQAQYRKDVIEKIQNYEGLKEEIKKEKNKESKKRTKNLLQSLDTIDNYWNQMNSTLQLEYQAKSKFTLLKYE